MWIQAIVKLLFVILILSPPHLLSSFLSSILSSISLICPPSYPTSWSVGSCRVRRCSSWERVGNSVTLPVSSSLLNLTLHVHLLVLSLLPSVFYPSCPPLSFIFSPLPFLFFISSSISTSSPLLTSFMSHPLTSILPFVSISLSQDRSRKD